MVRETSAVYLKARDPSTSFINPCLEGLALAVRPYFPKFGCKGSSVSETVTDKSVKGGQSGDALAC